MGSASTGSRVVVIAVVLVVVLLLSQGLATVTAPPDRLASTGRVLGQTGFAFLGGLRTFAAAVLWNRIEPVFHEYYSGVSLNEQKYMIPTLRLVVALDPQFTQAYYISSYIVFDASHEEGLSLAKLGIANNPDAGVLHANLAQLLFIDDKVAHRAEIMEQVALGSAPSAQWSDDAQRYEGFATMSQALTGIGETQAARALQARMSQVKARVGDVGDHDHDGDGKQDH